MLFKLQDKIAFVFLGVFLTLLLQRHDAFLRLLLLKQPPPPPPSSPTFAASDTPRAAQLLNEHSAEFRKEIVTVFQSESVSVHVAVGFALANTICIVTANSSIIIDTTESVKAARDVVDALKTVVDFSRFPVADIILTHNHADHVFGSQVFLELSSPAAAADGAAVNVYGHETLSDLLSKQMTVLGPELFRRSMRQFGAYIDGESGHLNSGIGPCLRFNKDAIVQPLYPTITFAKELKVTIGGADLTLLHAPGETDDQIVVVLDLPKTGDHTGNSGGNSERRERVLFAADNYYKAFPNIYAIRGTPSRSAMKWVASLDLMREQQADYMVPSHSRPVVGKKEIFERLTNYRDAIQYVHDQTIRMINKQMSIDDIATTLQLPEHLRDLDYLREYYGTVEWSSRSIQNAYLGWYDGRSANLFPLTNRERILQMIDMVSYSLQIGNDDKENDLLPRLNPVAIIVDVAKLAMSKGEFQWALELSHMLSEVDEGSALKLDSESETLKEEVVKIKIESMMALAEMQISANARNYYMTEVAELTGRILLQPTVTMMRNTVEMTEFFSLFQAMTVTLDPERTKDVDFIVHFHFRDADKSITMHVYKGVARVYQGAPNPRLYQISSSSSSSSSSFDGVRQPDLIVRSTERVWRDIVSETRSPALLFATGEISVEAPGGTITAVSKLVEFQQWFIKPVVKDY